MLDKKSEKLHLHLLPTLFQLFQFGPGQVIPAEVLTLLSETGPGFLSVTRTSEEVSIVSDITSDICLPGAESEGEKRWRCIRVKGPMEFTMTGVMCDLATPLKAAQIPIYVLSTWNTDWILVSSDKVHDAARVLQEDGWVVHDDGDPSRSAS